MTPRKIEAFKLDKKTINELAELPKFKDNLHRFTAEQDESIRYCWEHNVHRDKFTEWFSKKYFSCCYNTLRRRWMEISKK